MVVAYHAHQEQPFALQARTLPGGRVHEHETRTRFSLQTKFARHSSSGSRALCADRTVVCVWTLYHALHTLCGSNIHANIVMLYFFVNP